MDRCSITTVTTRWQQYLLGCIQWLSAFSVTTEEEMVFLSASTFRNELLYEKLGRITILITRIFIPVFLF